MGKYNVDTSKFPFSISREAWGYADKLEAIKDKPLKHAEYLAEVDRLDEAFNLANQELRSAYNDEQDRLHKLFIADMEQEHGLAKYSEAIRSHVHSQAWYKGHAYGYHEIANCYYDIMETVEVVANNV